MADFYVGQVVRFYPRVTGGEVVAVVTGVRFIPFWGPTVDIRVTDGTRYWPTGSTGSMDPEDLV